MIHFDVMSTRTTFCPIKFPSEKPHLFERYSIGIKCNIIKRETKKSFSLFFYSMGKVGFSLLDSPFPILKDSSPFGHDMKQL